jgi:hypothetical protein
LGDKIGTSNWKGSVLEPGTVSRASATGDDDSIKVIILHVNPPAGRAARRRSTESNIRDEKKKRTVVIDRGASGAITFLQLLTRRRDSGSVVA